MKHTREIKVGILATICIFLLYFGFYFLKGVNIFSPVHAYHGIYMNVNGLQEQAPVYVKGFKVGQVDHIHYDFTKDSSFIVDISINKDIRLPYGTQMALVADGLLGGTAVQLDIPVMESDTAEYAEGEFLPTAVIPGLLDNLQSGMLVSLSETIDAAKEAIAKVNQQLEGDHLHSALANVDQVSADLKSSSGKIKSVVNNQLPSLLVNVDSTMENIHVISSNLQNIDFAQVVNRVDSAVDNVNSMVSEARSTNGTLGKLINEKGLYDNVNATVQSVDSLITDIKANPKRYINVTIFGGKK